MTSAREEDGWIELTNAFCACGVESGVVAIAMDSCTNLAACTAPGNVCGSWWITKGRRDGVRPSPKLVILSTFRLLQPGTQAVDGSDVSIEALRGLHGIRPQSCCSSAPRPGWWVINRSGKAESSFSTSDGTAGSSSSHQVLHVWGNKSSLIALATFVGVSAHLHRASQPEIWCTRRLHLDSYPAKGSGFKDNGWLMLGCPLLVICVHCPTIDFWCCWAVDDCWCALCLKISVLTIPDHSCNPDTVFRSKIGTGNW